MNSKIHNTLASLGLNNKEIQVYLAGLSLGTSPASILGKKTNISRSTAQYTCQLLVEKGIFSVMQKGNILLYSPENPNKLLTLINKEYEKIEKKMLNTRYILGDLTNIMNPNTGIAKVKYYSGVEEIISLFEDIFTVGETIYGALELVEDMPEKMSQYINDIYIPKRKKSKIKSKMIFNDTRRTKNYQNIDKEMHRISLLVPKNNFPFDSCLHIYGNKIAFYSYKGNDMTGVMIENPNIKSVLFSLFKLAWNQARNLPENEKYKNEEL